MIDPHDVIFYVVAFARQKNGSREHLWIYPVVDLLIYLIVDIPRWTDERLRHLSASCLTSEGDLRLTSLFLSSPGSRCLMILAKPGFFV